MYCVINHQSYNPSILLKSTFLIIFTISQLGGYPIAIMGPRSPYCRPNALRKIPKVEMFRNELQAFSNYKEIFEYIICCYTMYKNIPAEAFWYNVHYF